ncbi:DNA starvation/stationary phase protection protein [Candidatus Gracilibacteria bacterium]|nr:DNA starvation/stationary phase protection protein [Candidatus Gracilibacteria bacterium]
MSKFDLQIEKKDKIISKLEILLASENVSNLKTRKYHRNVESKRFKGMHEFFEELYNASFERIDEIAERIRILGAYTKGTFKEYLELSIIKEEGKLEVSESDMFDNLAEDKLAILDLMKKIIDLASENGDVGTESLLSGFVEDYEKDLWMIRSMNK